MVLYKSMRTKIVFFALGILFCAAGCGKVKDAAPDYPAELQQILKKVDERIYNEIGSHIQYKLVGRTLWICVPVNKTLFILKRSEGTKTKNAFDYKVNGSFLSDDRALNFGYVLTEGTPVEPGVRAATSEEAEKITNFLYRYVFYEFTPLDRDKHRIDFVAFDLIDTVNKVGLSYAYYIEDLKKILYGVVRGQEISLRVKQEFSYVSDEDAKRNTYCTNKKEILWGDFIANQIQARAASALKENTGFQRETDSAALEDKILQTVVSSAKETLQYYPFKDFTKLFIKNIALKKDCAPPAPRIFYNYELLPDTDAQKKEEESLAEIEKRPPERETMPENNRERAEETQPPASANTTQ